MGPCRRRPPDEDLVLGSGRRLFTDGGPLATFRLVDSVTTTTGVLVATYQPTRTNGRHEHLDLNENARGGVTMTTSEPNDHAIRKARRATTTDLSWMLWTAIGIGGIWVAVLLLSLLAPDLVSGSQQEHLPVAAFTTWFWGGIGTMVLLWAMGRLRGSVRCQPIWIGLSVATLGIWAVATILGITLPVMVTGTDPTRIPFAAIFAPVAAAMLTALAGGIATVFRQGLGASSSAP
jgi:hypothetical protein